MTIELGCASGLRCSQDVAADARLHHAWAYSMLAELKVKRNFTAAVNIDTHSPVFFVNARLQCTPAKDDARTRSLHMNGKELRRANELERRTAQATNRAVHSAVEAAAADQPLQAHSQPADELCRRRAPAAHKR